MASPRRRTTFVHTADSTSAALLPADHHGQEPRQWLALGLACMVYIAGIAGLVSMVVTFSETGSTPVTPAGAEQTLPPIDETIDVRDARLDGPFIPAFKPEALDGLAASDLQKQS